MTEPRVWVASLGTSLDGPGWTEVGRSIDDGLDIIDDLPQTGPLTPWPTTLLFVLNRRTGRTRSYYDDGTSRARRRLIKAVARFDRTERAIRWPAASRVKRAYHQRRR